MVYVNKSDIYKLFDESNGVIKLHIADVDMLLTADVEEVKHGEWIERRGQSYLVHPMKFDVNGEPILQDYITYVCSCCGRTESNKEPYCNCGAKMDGERF